MTYRKAASSEVFALASLSDTLFACPLGTLTDCVDVCPDLVTVTS